MNAIKTIIVVAAVSLGFGAAAQVVDTIKPAQIDTKDAVPYYLVCPCPL